MGRMGGYLRGVTAGDEDDIEDDERLSIESCDDSDWDSRCEDEMDSESDEEEELQLPDASTPRRKKKTGVGNGGPWAGAPSSARKPNGVNGTTDVRSGARQETDDDGVNPWEGMPGLSLCQFWRYRLLLEVALAARGSGDYEEHDDEEVGVVVDGGWPRWSGERLAEVRLCFFGEGVSR